MGDFIKVGFVTLFVSLGLGASAVAGPLEEGVAAYNNYDYATALKTLRPLADQGNTEAQFYLGVIFRNGSGVPTDYAEAAKWLQLAADHGNAEAQYDLGNLYIDGKGVRQDYAEAAKWLRLAADQGYAASQEELGYMYASGTEGVPQDSVRAYTWYTLAAAHGGKYSAARRDVLAKKMTPDQIAEAQRLAREWKPTPQH